MSYYFKSQQYAICWPWPTCIHSFPLPPLLPLPPWVSLFGHWDNLTLSDQTPHTKHLNLISLCCISNYVSENVASGCWSPWQRSGLKMCLFVYFVRAQHYQVNGVLCGASFHYVDGITVLACCCRCTFISTYSNQMLVICFL